mmetsp:Transcript_2477/g.4144  ORF Transcript_2477/g.4144 Transcript_2477/m.4144 type:complete len:218 (+) Transcript_2477:120-773(+)
MSQPTGRRDSNVRLSRQKRKSDFVDRVQVVEDDRYAFTLQSPPLTATARVVDVSMNIERVFDVDTVTQTFGVQVSVMMTWLMPCFEEPKPPEQDDGDWIPEWTPKYKFKNLMVRFLYPCTCLHTIPSCPLLQRRLRPIITRRHSSIAYTSGPPRTYLRGIGLLSCRKTSTNQSRTSRTWTKTVSRRSRLRRYTFFACMSRWSWKSSPWTARICRSSS